jgi:hypothetical protein
LTEVSSSQLGFPLIADKILWRTPSYSLARSSKSAYCSSRFLSAQNLDTSWLTHSAPLSPCPSDYARYVV